MALESTTYISGLVVTNPTSSDNISDGDNHIRLLKSTIKATFPNIAGAVTGTSTQINDAVSVANAATHTGTVNAIVRRDGSGNFSAGTITAALTGNVTGNVSGSAGTASTAGRWTTARTISLTGHATGSATIRGDANANIAVTVANNSHTHTIANVDGLSTALGGKLSTTGNAASASTASTAARWTTARTISLTGDVTGSASIRGDANVAITATVANDSHNHDGRYYTEGEVNNLLAGKLSTSGTAANSDKVDGYNVVFNQAGTASNTIYFRT